MTTRNALSKTALLLGATALLLGQTGGVPAGARDQFAGAWRLVRLEQPGSDGKPHAVDCTGFLVYTRAGHMTVQVMDRIPSTHALSSPQQYSQGGYEASWGTITIDEHSHTFTYHVEGALVRSLIGQHLPRSYEFSGRQLIVKSTRADERWRAVWQRD